jgi:hypothetical protein
MCINEYIIMILDVQWKLHGLHIKKTKLKDFH